MFTGLVEAVGRVRRVERRGPSAKIFVEAPFDDLALGDSVCVSGACLTVTRVAPDGFEADMSAETLAVTTLGRLAGGSKVNLERATKMGARLGGHMVLGHVDGVGYVVEKTEVGGAYRTGISVGAELAPFLAAKGSVSIEGVSLTVNDVTDVPATSGGGKVVFTLMLIPLTLSATTLKDLAALAEVNVEVDVLARYVARQLAVMGSGVSDVGLRPHTVDHARDSSRGTDADQRLLDKLKHGGWG